MAVEVAVGVADKRRQRRIFGDDIPLTSVSNPVGTEELVSRLHQSTVFPS